MDPFRVKGLEVGGKRLSFHPRRALTDEEFIVLIKPIVKTVAVSQGIGGTDEQKDKDCWKSLLMVRGDDHHEDYT